uniref:Uncharacterized protein n=1 Tax=Megaselia scalaris TaxID=36166 RepID=T1GJ62_MEGSC
MIVVIHSPEEIPDFENAILTSDNKDLSVSIIPRVIQISDGLKNVDISKRQCYLQNEKYLQHFKIYTQSNCEHECLTNLTLKICGCVKLYMPRTETTEVCGSKAHFCTENALDLLLRKALEYKGLKCDCLPSCSSIFYNIETPEREQVGNSSHKILKFYFKENNFVSWKRYEGFGANDFLASVGGVLGLFLGISVMSVIEIVYFFTIRLYTHYFGGRH